MINRKRRKGYGKGKKVPAAFDEVVSEVVNAKVFCVKMIEKILDCSHQLLYYRAKNPLQLGGKYFRSKQKMPLTFQAPRKPPGPNNLIPIEDLLRLECCERKSCANFSRNVTVLHDHRKAYSEGNQVSCIFGRFLKEEDYTNF